MVKRYFSVNALEAPLPGRPRSGRDGPKPVALAEKCLLERRKQTNLHQVIGKVLNSLSIVPKTSVAFRSAKVAFSRTFAERKTTKKDRTMLNRERIASETPRELSDGMVSVVRI